MNAHRLETIRGKAWLFSDDVDTGQIIPGKYIPVTDPYELAKHVFEDVRPDFVRKVQEGDIVVGGENFGSGSSREHAPKALKYSGVSAVVAKSFARIFYRNALNIGLLAIAIPDINEKVEESDVLIIDAYKGEIENVSKKEKYLFKPFDSFVLDMLEAGGIIKYTLDKVKNKNT